MTILVQSGFVLGYIISGCLLSHVKRKVHFSCGALLMAISQAILGLTLKANFEISESLLPLCTICTSFGYGLGVGPVLHALLGEVLPLKIKSVATAIIMSIK